MTRFIIVRHAESALNCENRIQGHKDSCLTEKGLSQARQLAKRLKRFDLDAVFSSDLGRAFATTREITRHFGIPIKREPGLREIHLGAWEGLTPEEVNKAYRMGYQKWLVKPSSIRIPGSESLAHFRRRVVGCMHGISKAHRGRTVLVVTHGGVITALLAHWLKADFDHLLLNLQITNTSLTFVEETGKRTRVHTVNDFSHLTEKHL